jgi:hypothetical protein
MSWPYIVLTEEQMRIIEQANGPVDVRDAEGRPVASLRRLTAEDLEMIAQSKANRAAGGTPIPSAQVQAHLRRLAEIDAVEPLDRDRALELLRRMRAGEEG